MTAAGPTVATVSLTLETVRALSFVCERIEGRVPEWVYAALMDALLAAEDQAFGQPAADAEALGWKMRILGDRFGACAMDETLQGYAALLREDIGRLLIGETTA